MVDDRDEEDEAPTLVELPVTDLSPRLLPPRVRPKRTSPSLSPAAAADILRSSSRSPTPLTILTGFLGAGKTTLVSSLLRHFGSRGQRVAIINNEASASEVEPALVESSTVMSFGTLLTLANGCVCCSLTSDLISALNYMLQPQPQPEPQSDSEVPSSASGGPFVYVLVECSGLASPGPLLEQLWVDEALEQRVYLDGVVCVVDCKHFLGNLSGSEGGQMEQQLVFSDRVIVNKADTVSDGDVQRVLSEVRRINSQCEAIAAVRSQVPVDSILNIRAFDRSLPRTAHEHSEHQDCHASSASSSSPSSSSCSVTASADSCPPHAPAHGPSPSVPPVHDRSLVNVVFSSNRRVSLPALKAWLSDVLWSDVYDEGSSSDGPQQTNVHHSDIAAVDAGHQRVYRMKAAMRASDGTVWFLQSVQRLFDLFEAQAEEDKRSVQGVKIVVIGRNLQQDTLEAGFQSILRDSADTGTMR